MSTAKALHIEPEPEPISPVSAYAAGILAEAQDIDRGHSSSLPKMGSKLCRGCEQYKQDCEDGVCASCRGEQPGPDEMSRRHRAAARQGHLNTAKLLRRIASERGLNSIFASVLLSEADEHERRARR